MSFHRASKRPAGEILTPWYPDVAFFEIRSRSPSASATTPSDASGVPFAFAFTSSCAPFSASAYATAASSAVGYVPMLTSP